MAKTKTTKIVLAEEFEPLFDEHWRHICYYGSRSSGKSTAVAYALLLRGRMKKHRILCVREFQNSIADSVYKLLSDLINKHNFTDYEIQRETIKNKLTGTEFIFKGLRKDIQTIKSLEGVTISWCFPAGTLVDDKPIETYKVGEYVMSWDEQTNEIIRKKVTAVLKRPMPQKMYRLTYAGKLDIITTGEHPFWTQRGWTPAKDIKQGDYIYASETKLTRNYALPRRMWEKIRRRHAWSSTDIPTQQGDVVSRVQQQKTVRTTEEEQPDAQSRDTQEGIRYTKDKRPSSSRSWWKWARLHSASANAVQRTESETTWLVDGNEHPYRKEERRRKDASSVQGRYSKRLLWNMRRGGWKQTQRDDLCRKGREERQVLRKQRVDSVEVLEQGRFKQLRPDSRTDYVYNLTVEDTHTYFASGLLTHNCEEAQTITAESIDTLIPTIRTEGSQLIWTFNRLSELDPVFVKLCQKPSKDTYVKKVNSDVLERIGQLPQVIIDEREKMKREEPGLYAHVWLGEPLSQTDNAILGRDNVLQAMMREVEPEGQVEIGVDVARFGDDRTELVKRKGLKEIDRRTYTKLRTTEVAEKVIAMADNDKTILIKVDDTGVGSGVSDDLIKQGYNVIPINFGAKAMDSDKYPNLISEAWFYMEKIIDTIQLKNDTDLLMELSSRKWAMDSKGRRGVESKDSYKKRGFRSPDKADATILAFYTPEVKQFEYLSPSDLL